MHLRVLVISAVHVDIICPMFHVSLLACVDMFGRLHVGTILSKGPLGLIALRSSIVNSVPSLFRRQKTSVEKRSKTKKLERYIRGIPSTTVIHNASVDPLAYFERRGLSRRSTTYPRAYKRVPLARCNCDRKLTPREFE